MSDLSNQPKPVLKVKITAMKSAVAMSVSLISKKNRYPSWTRVLGALVLATNFSEQLLLVNGIRRFGSVCLGPVIPGQLNSMKCKLTRNLQSGGLSANLRGNEERGKILMVEVEPGLDEVL